MDQHPVGSGKVHAVADCFAVINDIIMGKHDSLGKPVVLTYTAYCTRHALLLRLPGYIS